MMGLTSLPYAQYKKNPAFYLWYDGAYMVGCLLFIALLVGSHYAPPIQDWSWWLVAALPIVCYAHTLASVFIHNAVHGNFPKWINRVVGELCGIVVLTRFASWEIVHRRHHRYSDDRARDPHPVQASFWKFVWDIIFSVEEQLQQEYFDLYGDTPETRYYERWRAHLSYATNLVLVACWYVLLGPLLFWVWYFPAFIVGFLHVAHFNWCTHNAEAGNGDYHPVNLNGGWYRFGNKLFFGIYMHENHHKIAKLFNPMKMAQRQLTAGAAS